MGTPRRDRTGVRRRPGDPVADAPLRQGGGRRRLRPDGGHGTGAQRPSWASLPSGRAGPGHR